MYGFHQAQLLSNMAIGIFTLRQQLRGLLSKNWTGTIKTPYVEYLVVGGGGGGGRTGAGGGGAGGVLTGILPVTTGATNNVTVGGGGAGGATTNAVGANGQNSVLNSLIAIGGGGGGSGIGAAGASGGGSGCEAGVTLPAGGQGTFGQGNAGGQGGSSTIRSSGGGGGAGTVGIGAVASDAGAIGGAGIASAISGTVTPYGGGGGGAYNATSGGAGGVGGGGRGGYGASTAAVAGTANTGGGGGGDWNNAGAGAGGSGIVIVSYPDIYAALTTGGATSPTVSTSGSGSLFVSGTYQSYVEYPANAAFAYGTGAFTFECWFYATAVSGNCLTSTSATNSAGSFAVFFSSGTLYVRIDGTGNDITYVPSGITNAWHHIAVVRVSGTNVVTVYIDGAAVASATRTNNITQNQPRIGQADSGNGFPFNGYISNARFVKGVAVYTGAFTPPTAPLQATQVAGTNISAITGTSTSLLLNTISSSLYADRSTNCFNATVVGTTSWNTLSPFASGQGLQNRVYTWAPTVSAGGTATGTFTV